MPEIQRHTRKALRAGKCVVIGLQSTGDSAVKESLARAGGKASLPHLVSAARESVEAMLDTFQKALNRTPYHMSLGQGELDEFRQRVLRQLDALELPPSALDEVHTHMIMHMHIPPRSTRGCPVSPPLYMHMQPAARSIFAACKLILSS